LTLEETFLFENYLLIQIDFFVNLYADILIKPPDESLKLGRNPDRGRFFHTHPQDFLQLIFTLHSNILYLFSIYCVSKILLSHYHSQKCSECSEYAFWFISRFVVLFWQIFHCKVI
jgi:hypothetical protein